MNQVLLYVGAFSVIGWGVSHLFPTRSVVAGFGDITIDNRRIITMEWIIEGVALIFIGTVVALVTLSDPSHSISRLIYWASFAVLNVLSAVSLFTGFRVSFLPYKLCPIIFTSSSILILIGGCLQS